MSTPNSHRLLVVDDEPDLRTLYELTLLREGYTVDTAGSVDDAWQHLQSHTYSVVITDMRLPDGLGLDLLQRIEAAKRPERTIVITAYGSAENAVTALKAGAYDYLTKPVDLKQFRAVVASAVQGDTLSGKVATGLSAASTSGKTLPAVSSSRTAPQGSMPASLNPTVTSRLTGNSPAIEQVRAMIDKVARSMAPVLLWGESGTGKELVAKSIHEVSTRHKGPFIAVNCGAIPEHLLEAEFFGYRKGAFTGASEDREGFFQAAQGGTLFLDEIGDLPLSMQSKLLRAIQERAIRPVGTTTETPVDVRIVSASHKNLGQEVELGRFRQDLFYRLNVIRICLPALRDRLADLPLLSQSLLQKIGRESGLESTPQLSTEALQTLQQHTFPGNIRELENMLQRAVAMCAGDTIEAEDLGLSNISTEATPAPVSHTKPSIQHTDFAPTQPAALSEEPLASPQADADALPTDLASHLDHIEREILVRALNKHRLNRTAAGASLGLSLRQMRYRMARLGVQVSDQGVVLGERFDPEQDIE